MAPKIWIGADPDPASLQEEANRFLASVVGGGGRVVATHYGLAPFAGGVMHGLCLVYTAGEEAVALAVGAAAMEDTVVETVPAEPVEPN